MVTILIYHAEEKEVFVWPTLCVSIAPPIQGCPGTGLCLFGGDVDVDGYTIQQNHFYFLLISHNIIVLK